VDPFKLLKKDHKKVSGLLKQLEKTEEQDSSERGQLFQQVKNELEVHTRIEETIFYPALKEDEETKDIAMEAYEEHAAVKRLLEEMSELDTSDEQWTAKCTVLKENVEHHVEEEEGEMFKKAKSSLESEELERLGDEMMKAKGEMPGYAEEEEEEEEFAGAASPVSARRSTPKRSRASAARSSGSRSRSKSSVKSARRKTTRSASKKSSKKKAGSKKKSSW
jgi:hypothetical protein